MRTENGMEGEAHVEQPISRYQWRYTLKTLTSRLVGLVGLSALVLLVGLAILTWVTPISAMAPTNIERGNPQLPPASTRHVSLIQFRKLYDFGSSGFKYEAYDCFDHGDCSAGLYRRQIRQITLNHTFRFFGPAIKLSGRVWLIDESWSAFDIYFELSRIA
jgi:hypothetical protein